MPRQIIQEKYIAIINGNTMIQVLTRGGFKRCRNSSDLKHCEVRIFNSIPEARTYVETRYNSENIEYKKVMVCIEFLEQEEEEIL